MRNIARVLTILAAAAFAATATPAAETKTLKGSFEWSEGVKGDLEAVFTPTGEGTWDVSFRFQFRGQDHLYSGTAEGSLAGGALQGKVQNEDRRRTFTFAGAVEGGEFRGTHAEITGGENQPTGTLRLKS